MTDAERAPDRIWATVHGAATAYRREGPVRYRTGGWQEVPGPRAVEYVKARSLTAGTDEPGADMNKLAAMLLALADGYPPTIVAHSVDEEEPTAVFFVENPKFAPDNGEDPNIGFEVNDLRAIASRLRAQAARAEAAEGPLTEALAEYDRRYGEDYWVSQQHWTVLARAALKARQP